MAITLIEQIDQLSKIAGEFSQFANIGNTKIEKLNLQEVIDSVVRLYQTHPGLQIHWEPQNLSIPVWADRVQMNRLLTNLLQNASEARSGDEAVEVIVSLEIKDESVYFSVKDNAGGIPDSMQSKIFTPNFTTKSSGTGLGLAMCKGIVENANGRIWFETEEGVGTTFFIQLPVATT